MFLSLILFLCRRRCSTIVFGKKKREFKSYGRGDLEMMAESEIVGKSEMVGESEMVQEKDIWGDFYASPTQKL